MKETKRGFVEIPRQTLSALKGLLFDNENGVDLSSIITDLSPHEEDKDLTAINVALVFKGLAPKIDSVTRYERDYRSIVRYEFVGYSLILGIVKVRRSIARAHKDENGNIVFDDYVTSQGIECIGFPEWENYNTDETAVKSEVISRFC